MTEWNSTAYGVEVARLLALDGAGARLMPLAGGACSSETARREIASRAAVDWFPGARAPEAALAGLYLYFSCSDEAHTVAQDVSSTDGSYWHAVVHRQEPDAANARYWFQRAGAHQIFPRLLARAREIGAACKECFWMTARAWDPEAFIDLCEEARRRPGSERERVALEIQRAEWQLLFDHCARSQA
jgi:hypothetical protein